MPRSNLRSASCSASGDTLPVPAPLGPASSAICACQMLLETARGDPAVQLRLGRAWLAGSWVFEFGCRLAASSKKLSRFAKRVCG